VRYLDVVAISVPPSASDIAAELDKRKVETPRGGVWHPQLVKRMVRRLDEGRGGLRPEDAGEASTNKTTP
jgi:hypothetical protein